MVDFSTLDRLFLISGPCVIESEGHCLETAGQLGEIGRELDIPVIFKASFDKANRTSRSSFRGPGLEKGLETLHKVKEVTGLPVTSDVHETSQVVAAAGVLDIIQIPAFLSRQTDLITSAAATGRPVNIKKGQFLAPWDARHAVEKARAGGARDVLVTERGASFGYNNLVVDFKSLPILRGLGAVVVFDGTHSVQLPGGKGSSSGGQAQFISALVRAALAVGVHGLFLEVHHNPEQALSDGTNALPLDSLKRILEVGLEIDLLARKRIGDLGLKIEN